MVKTLAVKNPATGEVLREVAITTQREVLAALARARAAQKKWGGLSAAERARRLRPLQKLLLEETSLLAREICLETGKPIAEALSMEVLPLLELVHVFTEQAPAMLAERSLRVRVAPHKRNQIVYQPRGVVAIIAPFNFPLAIAAGECVLALLAGNAVLLKPSEYTPLIALRFASLVQSIGLDPNLLQVLPGAGATGEALVKAGVDFVSFTGSDVAGRTVGAACGAQPIPFRLELGGKADVVICHDADLRRAAPALCWGAFANGGQVCAGAQRVYVPASLLDDLGARLQSEIEALVTGDPQEEGVDLGFLCPPKLPDHVNALIDDAEEKGASVVIDGRGPKGDRRVRPTLLVAPPADARILRRECFGPVLALVPIANEAEAVARANAAPGDLCAYVFGENKASTNQVARQLRAGTVMVNDVVWSYGMPEAPWAAVSRSGVGVSHGEEGLRSFTSPRHIVEERLRVLTREPYWYPYSKKRLAQLRRGLVALYATDLKSRARGLLGRPRRKKAPVHDR